MFLTVLGGTLALGAGLLAAAGYSEGGIVAARTAALTIGWLLLFATLLGMQGVRRRRPAQLGTTVVVFVSGIGVLYLSIFIGPSCRSLPSGWPQVRSCTSPRSKPSSSPSRLWQVRFS